MQYGGLWCNVGDLEENIAQLEEKQKKVAIITQIKYQKLLLGTKVSDKRLLQLSSNKRVFSTQELEGNLRAILLNINTVASDTSSSNVSRDVDERKRLINDCITKKSWLFK